jgi:predicted Zn-dependent protease
MRFVRRSVPFAAVFAIAAVALAQDQATPNQTTGDQTGQNQTGQNPAQAGKPNKDPKKDPDQIGNRDVSKGLNWYSIDKEIALGKQLAIALERSVQIVDDPVIAEYISRVGQNLVRNSDSKFPFTIKVIRDESINALSLPGGFFYVNTGLILTAATEAELAGGMAHEIAHIAARHGTRQATRAQVAQLATIPLIFMGGWAGYGARQGAGALIPMTFLGFDRAFESEADLLGLEYLYKTGYDPNGMVDIFEKIEALNKTKPGRVSKLFSTHPPTGDRIVTVQKNIQNLLKSQPQYVVNTSEFNDVKARLTALENRRKPGPQDDPNRPQLRRAPDRNLAGNSARPAVLAYVDRVAGL